jgi:hypothetical protein
MKQITVWRVDGRLPLKRSSLIYVFFCLLFGSSPGLLLALPSLKCHISLRWQTIYVQAHTNQPIYILEKAYELKRFNYCYSDKIISHTQEAQSFL